MTNYYTNKPDFTEHTMDQIGAGPKNMRDHMDSIQTLGEVVKNEGASSLYRKTGDASLGTTKDV